MKDKFKIFLAKLGGADPAILKLSGWESHLTFYILGGVNLIIYLMIFIAFYGFASTTFDSPLSGLVVGTLITFLISNIYRINMMSLEPHTLPVVNDGSSLLLTYTVRVFSTIVFALVSAKCLETYLLGFMVDEGIPKEYFIRSTIKLNEQYPKIWIFSSAVILFFHVPILFKYRLKKAEEYYNIRQRQEIRMVIREYDIFHRLLILDYETIYKKYNDPNKKFKMHPVRFEDEPFNTKRLVRNPNYKSTDDFIDLYDVE